MQKEKESVHLKRNRQKKIGNLKTYIVLFVLLSILLSLVSNIYLFVKVIKLEKKINKISLNRIIRRANSKKRGYIIRSKFNKVATGESNLRDKKDTMKVYLTFDDGPSENTDKVLDILDDYSIKATFFVVGKKGKDADRRYKRIVKEGHTIGMHSYTHDYSDIYASLSNFSKDYKRIFERIKSVTGVSPKYYRFPGGSINNYSRRNILSCINYLDENKIKYFDWNVSAQDATNKPLTKDDIIENILKDVVKYKTSVVLLHDSKGKDETVNALPELIKALQEMGAVILPISNDTKVIQFITLED